jgi:hypothetical protein
MRVTLEIFTTAGITRSSMGARVGMGWPLTAVGSAAFADWAEPTARASRRVVTAVTLEIRFMA